MESPVPPRKDGTTVQSFVKVMDDSTKGYISSTDSFIWVTTWMSEDQGEFDLRTMPIFSITRHLDFVAAHFSRLSPETCEWTGGPSVMKCNAMLVDCCVKIRDQKIRKLKKIRKCIVC